MFGGINPKQMEGMMKKMGIAQEEIKANRVIIECDDKNIVIENPDVMKIKMGGQQTFQISGEATEVAKGASEDDIAQVMEKTGKSKAEAKKALEASGGDLAEAILSLSD